MIHLLLPAALSAPAQAADILVYDPLDYYEATVLTAVGHAVTSWSQAEWEAASTEDFAAFDAIVIGDEDCSGPETEDFDPIIDTAATFLPAITGNVVVTGTDAACHYGSSGAADFLVNSVDWAAQESTTGAYFSSDWARVDFEYLGAWGTFGSTSSHGDTVTITDSTHAVFDGISSINGWGNTYHAYIDTYPSDFTSIAEDSSGNAIVIVRDETCDMDEDGYDSEDCDGQDCDDDDDSVSPAATEVWYDGADQDCDGESDYDADSDGDDSTDYGGGDCDDADDMVNSSATETWYDGVDQDCDGASDYDADSDGEDSDAYGGDDCDDTDADINPDASDTWYDGVDSECDGANDSDADGDGYDSADHGGDDCDDDDASVSPGASEVEDDGIDQDCDGEDLVAEDGDEDKEEGDYNGGCACSSTRATPAAAWLLALLPLAAIRRRRT